MTTSMPAAQDLAAEFVNAVRKYVSPDDCREIDRRNAAQAGNCICHSHDFCDSNQAMINALEVFGIEYDGQDEPQGKLIDDAWMIAKAAGFAAKDSLVYRGKARKAAHGSDGVIYLNSWATGYQELVFPSNEAAERWAKNNNCEFRGRDACEASRT